MDIILMHGYFETTDRDAIALLMALTPTEGLATWSEKWHWFGVDISEKRGLGMETNLNFIKALSIVSHRWEHANGFKRENENSSVIA